MVPPSAREPKALSLLRRWKRHFLSGLDRLGSHVKSAWKDHSALLIGGGIIGGLIACAGAIAVPFIEYGLDKSKPSAQPQTAPLDGKPTPSFQPTDDPITVAVKNVGDVCGSLMMVSKRDGEFPRPQPGERIDQYMPRLKAAGGVSALDTLAQFTVQGKSEAQVTLTDLDVRVISRTPSPRGTHIDPACGDAGVFRWVEANLDKDPPELTAGVNEASREFFPPVEQKPIRFPYGVSLTEAESFFINASVESCNCEWEAELSWTSQGRSGKYLINDGGKPFRTTGISAASATCSVGDNYYKCEPKP